MHFSAIGAFASLLAVGYADCNHNNCLRAVLGVSFPTRSGLADCMSYLQATVTPATSTITVTQTGITTTPTTTTTTDSTTIFVPTTVTTTDIAGATVTITATVTDLSGAAKRGLPAIKERQVTVDPTNIPAYALAPCSSVAASYAYACSCIGAIPSTITVVAPSTTITVSATSTVASLETQTVLGTTTDTYVVTATTFQTVTTTSVVIEQTTVCSPDPSSFYLRASNGFYLQYLTHPSQSYKYGGFQAVATIGGGATIFSFDAAGNVYIPNFVGPYGGQVYLAGDGGEESGENTLLFGLDANEIGPTGASKLPCEIDSTTQLFTCTYGPDTVFDAGYGYILVTEPANQYLAITFFADCT